MKSLQLIFMGSASKIFQFSDNKISLKNIGFIQRFSFYNVFPVEGKSMREEGRNFILQEKVGAQERHH
jgi:hypothetical protein